MTINKKYNVLVIGSKDHKSASKCIEWGEELVYVGDYDALIINTTTLTKEILQSIVQKDNGYFEKIRKDITNVQEVKGIKITCIITPYVFAKEIQEGDPNDILINTINNYSWSPIIPFFEEIPQGEKLNFKEPCLPKTYLDKIKKYSLLFKNSVNNTGYVDKSKDGYLYTKLHKYSLLNNVVGRNVAFAIQWKLHKYSDYTVLADSNFPIKFIPPTENVNEGVDILISELCRIEEESAPEWIEDITIPGEEEIQKTIDKKFQEIDIANKGIQALEDQLESLRVYKKLLYAQGIELEEIVEKSLALLGVPLKLPSVSNKEDRFFTTTDDKKIYIEIRGVNRLMSEGDLTQLIKRIAEKPISINYKTRGIFIFNHQNKKKITERAEAFHHNIEKQAKTFDLGLIDTVSLFELIKRKLQGNNIGNFDKVLFNTLGVFRLNGSETEKVSKE